MDGFNSSFNFHFFLFGFKPLRQFQAHHHPHLPYILFVLWQGLSIYLSFCFLLFSFCDPTEQQNSLGVRLFSFLINTRSDPPTEIGWSICIAKSNRILCISFYWTDYGLCIYHLVIRWNFNFLHNSQSFTFRTQSCLILYFFCVRLLHSLLWLTVLSFLHITYICYSLSHFQFSL